MRVGFIVCTRGRLEICVMLLLALLLPAQQVFAQTPPAITFGPDDLSVQSGASATFQVNATGSAPIVYRWFFNGTNLPSAAGATLTIPNVSMFHGGLYSVIA